MKRASFIIVTIVAAILTASAQTGTQGRLRKSLFLIEGLFFDSIPDLMKKEKGVMALLAGPDKERIVAIYLPDSVKLRDEVAKFAIPVEKIPHADVLLKDYYDRRPQINPTGAKHVAEVGKQFPKFSYNDIDGKTWSRESLKGKVWVLNLWQKECGPCRKEMPELSKWCEEFPDVIFLSASRHAADVIRPIVTQHHFTWTHLQEAKTLVSLVGAKGFPLTIIVDREGIVRYACHGASAENQQAALAVIKELSVNK